jgi:electron transfer flavoprotein alpha subunit
VSAVALVVARGGTLPAGADEAITEARGRAIVVGEGAEVAAASSRAAHEVRWFDTGIGFHAGALTAAVVPLLRRHSLVILPMSPDGRDLAPRLAVALDAAFLGAVSSAVLTGGRVHLVASRLDARVAIDVTLPTPAVVTLSEGAVLESGRPPKLVRARTRLTPAADVEVIEVLDPDPATMDLADAPLVLAGGAGLVQGLDDAAATKAFRLLGDVATALGASAGATRVVTDAGWLGPERQIGTTGVAINPRLYVALGISGASQHVGGLGAPDDVVSVNTDPSGPMTAMADLGIVSDAHGVLLALAKRLGVSA